MKTRLSTILTLGYHFPLTFMSDYFITVDVSFLSNVKVQDFNPSYAFKNVS